LTEKTQFSWFSHYQVQTPVLQKKNLFHILGNKWIYQFLINLHVYEFWRHNRAEKCQRRWTSSMPILPWIAWHREGKGPPQVSSSGLELTWIPDHQTQAGGQDLPMFFVWLIGFGFLSLRQCLAS
jgi:hypothetical protein